MASPSCSGRSAGPGPDPIGWLAGHGVPGAALAEAHRLARLWAVPADEALIRADLAPAETVYRALAAEAGLPFLDTFAVHPRAQFPFALEAGLAPLQGDPASPGGAPRHVFAPTGPAFAETARRRGSTAPGLAITTPDRLRAAVMKARGPAIARAAAEDLARTRPLECFRDGLSPAQLVALPGFGLAAGALLVWGGGSLAAAFMAACSLPFLCLIAIKLAAVLVRASPAPDRQPPRAPDADLPVYTVLVPLFRESRVLPQLLGALRALDYPAARLDAKLIVEEDDGETASALRGLALPGFVEVVVAPRGEPRTKPRALNVALSLARGEFVVVYDAEDVPEPGQLRLAVAAFRRAEPDVACLQARLAIDNTADGLLTAFFTVEYGILFDVLNPALARFDLPVPLGGTSNHLRTKVLRDLGGWDPWNVTEDADLAIRLATSGFRVADLPSTTLEEAPRRLGPWMAQRTRWMKGFVQVAATHSRRPIRNFGRLGPMRLLGASVVTLGVVVSAFVYPFFALWVLLEAAEGALHRPGSVSDLVVRAVGVTVAVCGALAMILPGLIALERRRWWGLWPFALLLPAYYLLVSAAAWRGLWELVREPQRWNKTEHGLARTSRAGLV